LVPKDDDPFDAARTTLDTAVMSWISQLEPGVYHCTDAGCIPMRNPRLTAGHIVRILSNAELEERPVCVLLIDVKSYLGHGISTGGTGRDAALVKARRDFEWFLLTAAKTSTISSRRRNPEQDERLKRTDSLRR